MDRVIRTCHLYGTRDNGVRALRSGHRFRCAAKQSSGDEVKLRCLARGAAVCRGVFDDVDVQEWDRNLFPKALVAKSVEEGRLSAKSFLAGRQHYNNAPPAVPHRLLSRQTMLLVVTLCV